MEEVLFGDPLQQKHVKEEEEYTRVVEVCVREREATPLHCFVESTSTSISILIPEQIKSLSVVSVCSVALSK
jgi:hypothetical protein